MVANRHTLINNDTCTTYSFVNMSQTGIKYLFVFSKTIVGQSTFTPLTNHYKKLVSYHIEEPSFIRAHERT